MNEKLNCFHKEYPEMFLHLFNQTSDMVMLLSVDEQETFRYVLANDKALRLLNISETVIGKTLNEVWPKDKIAIVLKRFKKVLDAKTSLSFADPVHLENSHITGEAVLTPFMDDSGKCTHILTVVRDITEQTPREEKLKTNQLFFEEFFKHAVNPISLWSAEGEALEINPAFEKVFGHPREEFLGKITVETNALVPDHLKEEASCFFSQMLQGETISNYETTRKHKNGRLIDVSITYLPIKDQEGKVIAAAISFRDISQHKKLENQLEKSKEQLELVWNNTGDGIDIFTLDGRLLQINPAFTSLFGWTKEDTTGEKPAITLIPPHLKEELVDIRKQLRQGKSIVGIETQRQKKDGTFLDVLTTYNPLKNESGDVWAAVGVYKNITKQKQVQKKLKESESRYRLIAQHSHDMIKVLTLDGLITYASPSHKKILGFEPENVTGKIFFDFIHPEDVPVVKEKFSLAAAANQTWETQFRQYLKDKTWIWVEAIGTPIIDEERLDVNCQYIVAARDITERKQYEERLKAYAFQDSLTGLYNRRKFVELIDNAVEEAKRCNNSFAVLYLDIDKFKFVNDTYGHEIGDELLKKMAERLNGTIRKRDVVARIGGDEFTILLTDIDTMTEIIEAAERIHSVLQTPYEVHGQTFVATSSIGIALYPDHGEKTKTLLRHADEALYKAKESRNSYSIY